MGYTEVKKIYDKTRLDVFVMAIAHLMNIGFLTASQITDEDIEKVEGNGFMTKEYCQELNKIASEIAKNCTPSEFIQLCEAVEPFEVPEKLSRGRMEKIINDYIACETRSLTLMVADGSLEPEDLLALGYWTEEDVDKYYEEQEG